MEHLCNGSDRKNLVLWRKECHNSTLPTAAPKETAPRSIAGLQSDKQVTNHGRITKNVVEDYVTNREKCQKKVIVLHCFYQTP